MKWLLISSDIAHISGCRIKLCQGFDLLAKRSVNVVTEYLTNHSSALQNMFKDSLSDEMFTVRSWQEMLKEGNKSSMRNGLMLLWFKDSMNVIKKLKFKDPMFHTLV